VIAGIVGVAGCPHPPLLLTGSTGRPVAEVEQLRAACSAAIGELLAAGPSRIVLVGGARPGEQDTPLSIEVGRQLLAEADCRLPVEQLTIAADSAPADCLAAGRALAESAGPAASAESAGVGLLVMGDGSARRTLKAPGYLDERAAPFDAAVEECLASGRLAKLAELDAELAADLLVAGRAAWQVLAGALGEAAGSSTLHYGGDPFGVWYPVFSWLPAR